MHTKQDPNYISSSLASLGMEDNSNTDAQGFVRISIDPLPSSEIDFLQNIQMLLIELLHVRRNLQNRPLDYGAVVRLATHERELQEYIESLIRNANYDT